MRISEVSVGNIGGLSALGLSASEEPVAYGPPATFLSAPPEQEEGLTPTKIAMFVVAGLLLVWAAKSFKAKRS